MLNYTATYRNADKKPHDNKIDGGGPSTLSERYGIPLTKGRELFQKVFTGFPKLKPYFDVVGQEAKEKGYIVANEVSKRRSYIPFYPTFVEVRDKVKYFERRGWEVHPRIMAWYKYHDAKIQRWAQNIPVQATAADIAKQAGINLRKYALKYKFENVIFAHDEYVLECAKEKSTAVSTMLERAARAAVSKYLTKINVPADTKVTSAWSK